MSPEPFLILPQHHAAVPQERLSCPLAATSLVHIPPAKHGVLPVVSSQSPFLILSVDSDVWLLQFNLVICSKIKLLPFFWLTQYLPVDSVAAEIIGDQLRVIGTRPLYAMGGLYLELQSARSRTLVASMASVTGNVILNSHHFTDIFSCSIRLW